MSNTDPNMQVEDSINKQLLIADNKETSDKDAAIAILSSMVTVFRALRRSLVGNTVATTGEMEK